MNYTTEMGSGAMTYIPSFIKNGSGLQMLLVSDTQTHRQQGDLISLRLFFQNKERMLKMNQCENYESFKSAICKTAIGKRLLHLSETLLCLKKNMKVKISHVLSSFMCITL
jgi:hypothetical protein